MLLDDPETSHDEPILIEGVGPHETVCPDCWLVTQRRTPQDCQASFACSDDGG